MSEPINDGGPAYPVEFFDCECRAQNSTGMSLRDYFAGQAMQAWIHHYGDTKEGTAEAAYDYADAMLAERNNRK